MSKAKKIMESVFAITHGRFASWGERHRTHTIMGNGLTIEVNIAPDDKIWVRVEKGPEVVKALFSLWMRGRMTAVELEASLEDAVI